MFVWLTFFSKFLTISYQEIHEEWSNDMHHMKVLMFNEILNIVNMDIFPINGYIEND